MAFPAREQMLFLEEMMAPAYVRGLYIYGPPESFNLLPSGFAAYGIPLV
jgi:hypothetical protein